MRPLRATDIDPIKFTGSTASDGRKRYGAGMDGRASSSRVPEAGNFSCSVEIYRLGRRHRSGDIHSVSRHRNPAPFVSKSVGCISAFSAASRTAAKWSSRKSFNIKRQAELKQD
jgi:hypothetical protein